MALVVGCDPSAKKIALVAKETLTLSVLAEQHLLYPKGTTTQTPASLHKALDVVSDFAQELAHMAPEGQRFAWVEKPLVGRGGISTTIKQAYVGGVIRAALARAGFAVYDVHPSTWRKGIGVSGKGTAAVKASCRNVVRVLDPKMLTLVQHDDDLTEAGGICLYGTQQVGKADRIRSSGLAGGTV